MRAFLEQYGIAIFVIIILGFMIFSGATAGKKISNEMKNDGKEFKDTSLSELAGVEKKPGFVAGTTNPETFTLNWKKEDMYKVEGTVFDYDVKKEDFATFSADKESFVDIDCTYYKISDKTLDPNGIYYIDFLIKSGEYFDGSINVEKDVVSKGLMTVEDFDLGGNQPKLSGEADMYQGKVNGNNNMTVEKFPFLISVTTDDYAHKCGSKPNGLHLPKGTYLFYHAFVPIETYDHLKIQKITPTVDIIDIDGVQCVKISDDTFTKDGIIGKTIDYTFTANGTPQSQSMVIEESYIQDNTDAFNLMNMLFFKSDGMYVTLDVAKNLDTVNIEIK